MVLVSLFKIKSFELMIWKSWQIIKIFSHWSISFMSALSNVNEHRKWDFSSCWIVLIKSESKEQ
jgi:hypothetical protein